MAGKSIELIRKWVETLVVTLRQDPYALETAYISIITYGGSAKQITPLTTLSNFQLPALETNGSSVFAEAFELLMNRVNTEVTKTTPDYFGDWLPLVVIMTNNTPYSNFANDFKNRDLKGVLAVIGSNVDKKIIKRVTENIVSLDSFDSVIVLSYFKWVESSIGCTENCRICDDLMELSSPPEDVYVDLFEDKIQKDIPNVLEAALLDSDEESCSSDISFSEPKDLVLTLILTNLNIEVLSRIKIMGVLLSQK